MKLSAIAILLAAAMLTSSCSSSEKTLSDPLKSSVTFIDDNLFGGKDFETRVVDLKAFDHLISTIVKVEIVRGDSYSAKIIADKDIIDYVKVDQNQSRLTLSIDSRPKSIRNISGKAKVVLTVPSDPATVQAQAGSEVSFAQAVSLPDKTLRLNVSSGASVKADRVECGELEAGASSGAEISAGNVRAGKISLEASSGSDIVLDGATCNSLEASASSGCDIVAGNIESKSVSAGASSAGDIRLTGKTDEIKFIASSGSTIDALGLRAKNGRADASSSGSIKVNVSDKLTRSASSGGSVTAPRD